MVSGLPWDGQVRITIMDIAFPDGVAAKPFTLELRRPSWAGGVRLAINNEPVDHLPEMRAGLLTTASGYDPHLAILQPLTRLWSPRDEIAIDFEIPIRLRCAHPRVKGQRDQVALTRGPLVYCLENVDNPGIDIFTTRLDAESLTPVQDNSLLEGLIKLQGKTKDGAPLTFIPYFLWGNRGPSQMTVWVNA
jgi:DUF1680 family protein